MISYDIMLGGWTTGQLWYHHRHPFCWWVFWPIFSKRIFTALVLLPDTNVTVHGAGKNTAFVHGQGKYAKNLTTFPSPSRSPSASGWSAPARPCAPRWRALGRCPAHSRPKYAPEKRQSLGSRRLTSQLIWDALTVTGWVGLGRPGSSWSRRRCRPRTDLADGHWDFGGHPKVYHIVFPKRCWFFDVCWSLLSHACRGCLTAIATVCDSKGIRC